MRRPAPGSTRGVLTLLLAVLLALAGSATDVPAAAAGSGPTSGDRTAQVGRHADHDAVSGASTRLTSSRGRAAAPRAQLELGAAVVETAPSPTTQVPRLPVPASRGTAARSTPRGGTLSRAPPA